VILVDTSVWVDHLRKGDQQLAALLAKVEVSMHPFVVAEISLGQLRNRKTIIESLQALPQATVANDNELLAFVDANGLAGSGIGFVDAHLLAAARLSAGTSIWTRDRRLVAAASRLALLAPFA
jgi:predicted nucleic acid-binding protein